MVRPGCEAGTSFLPASHRNNKEEEGDTNNDRIYAALIVWCSAHVIYLIPTARR